MTDRGDDNRLTISVVIPTYNNAEHICRAIDSVLAQSVCADQIIIVDDGSTDSTADVLAKYGDKICCITQKNAGAAAARNVGIRAAASEWIAFVDSDDEWKSEKLKLQTEVIKANRDIVWVGGNYSTCLCEAKRIAAKIIPEKVRSILNGKDFFQSYCNAFLADMGGWTGTMLIRKRAFEQVGYFEEDMKVAEDWDMWFRLGCKFEKFGFISETVAVYHLIEGESLTTEQTDYSDHVNFLRKQLNLYERSGKVNEFKKCGRLIVGRWLRAMLFDKQNSKAAKQMLAEFGELLPLSQRLLFGMLSSMPATTAYGLRAISKFVRLFNLRRQVVRRPK